MERRERSSLNEILIGNLDAKPVFKFNQHLHRFDTCHAEIGINIRLCIEIGGKSANAGNQGANFIFKRIGQRENSFTIYDCRINRGFVLQKKSAR